MRFRVEGEIYNRDEDEIERDKTKARTIDVVIDRIVVKESARSRIFDRAQMALQRSDGLMVLDV